MTQIDPERTAACARGLLIVASALRNPRAPEAAGAIRDRLVMIRNEINSILAASESEERTQPIGTETPG